MRTLTINQTNLDQNDLTNSSYIFNFPVSRNFKEGDHIAIGSVNIFYSFFSVSASYKNQNLQYIWQDTLGSTTVNLTIPEGNYTVGQLNYYLQQVMISQNHYLINPSGDYVYYLELQENPVRYAVQLNVYPIPTVLPLGWSTPIGFPGFPLVSLSPQIVILPLPQQFSNIIGFAPGTYPAVPAVANTSILSTFTPQVTPFSSFIIKCSLVRNDLSNPNDSVYSFGPDVGFGSIINPTLRSLVFNKITPGTYNQFKLQITDQKFKQLNIRDTSLLIQLVLWIEDEDGALEE